jgi:cobyrinic acid a,c-diamide synthase
LSAHEFHYASITTQATGASLFDAVDATGTMLGTMGHRCGHVMGSFAHIIDYCPEAS